MLWFGLRTILMMFCGIVLLHTCTAKDTQKYGCKISTRLVSKHQIQNPNLSNYTRYSITGNGKSKPGKYWQCKPKSVEFIIIKLRNVIDRYDVKKSELKVLFSGVADSGLNKSEIFRDLLPKHRRLKDFNCMKFKYPKTLKKRTYELLSKFHSGVQRFNELFEELINYEKSLRFKKKYRSNRNKLEILNELQNDLKMLDMEILEVVGMKNKRLNFSRQPKNLPLPPPKSQTDLMVRQWEIIQRSKVFLKGWKRKLRKICKCWKKKSN